MTRASASISAFCVISLLLGPTLACSTDSAPSATGAKEGAGEQAEKPEVQKRPETPKVAADGKPLAVITPGIVDLGAILQKSPEEVEKLVGAPKDTGGHESSCVRFVPERVFFKCQHDFRIYEHPKLERLRIDYQDGAAAVVELIGLKGEGEFSETAALELAGLTLPEPGTHSSPAGSQGEVVDVWDWTNGVARLAVSGKQYRVRVSTIDKQWERSKLEIIDNSPLTDDQRGRIMQAKDGGDDGAAVSTPAEPAP